MGVAVSDGLVLELNGSSCRFRGPLPSDIEVKIDEMCKFRPAGFEHSPKFRLGEWDGYLHLFRFRRFPIGLLDQVKMLIALYEVPYKIEDHRHVGPAYPVEPMIALRDYQKVIVEAALQRGNGLVQAPTGAGKTVMFSHILCRLGLRALVIVPTVDLVDQVRSDVEEVSGILPEQITGPYIKQFVGEKEPEEGVPDPWDPTVEAVRKLFDGKGRSRWAVATWQLLSHAIKEVKKTKKGQRRNERMRALKKCLLWYDVVIADEAHFAGADAVYEVLAWIPAKHRYGVSATPFRTQGDDLRMFGAIGPIGTGISASELINKGYLVPPTIEFVDIPPVNITDLGKYSTVYREAVVENMDRNEIMAWETVNLVEVEKRPTLVMVHQIKHGQIFKKILEKHMPKSEIVFVNGSLSKKKRKKAAENMREGAIPVAISTSMWDQGVNFPPLSGGVLLGPNKSPVANTQRMGRFLRTHEESGKKDAHIIDAFDRVKFLRDSSLARYDLYKREEGFNVIS